MKNVFIFLLLISSAVSIAQTRDLKTFTFQEHDVQYTRVDYSNYGVAHFFITMYSSDAQYNLIEQNAYNCLLNKERIYHTLYFFIRVPEHITDPETKSKLFSEFVSHLKEVEQPKAKINLFLNFDQDYSKAYQQEYKGKSTYDVQRVIVDISPKTICDALTVQIH